MSVIRVDQQKFAPEGKTRVGAAISQDVARAARAYAGWRGVTLGDLLDEALREYLRERLPRAE